MSDTQHKMKVNVIIRIEDCEDNEQAIETKFNECETDTLMAKESLKLLHPVIRNYTKMFQDASAPNDGTRRPGTPDGSLATETRKPGSLERMVSPLSSSAGRLEQAKRFALMNYDHWNEVTGFPTPHTGYYYEIASLIEDAVEFGFGVAHGQTWKTIVRRLKRANERS